MKEVIYLGKSIIYYVFYAPTMLMFFILCRMHNVEGREFWDNFKINAFW